MNPQFIRTRQGEELVVLPRADYDALVAAAEDAEDVAIYDACMADPAGLERVPDEVSAALMKGDGLLTAFRKWRGLSLSQLAAKAMIGQDDLAELEHKKQRASPETIAALAKALDVPVNWLPS